MAVTANTIGGATTATTSPLPVASTIDPIQDFLAVYTASATATQAINRNTLLGVASQPLGLTDTQSPTNKTFNNTNSLTVLDTKFTIQDNSDNTKQAVFQLGALTTASTRTYTLPDISDTLTTNTAPQILTNKSLTAPIVTNGSSLNVDSILGNTSANSLSIAGITITSSKVPGTNITNSTIGPNQLATGAATASVLTSETTTSTSYAQLTTKTDAVTVTIGVNGLALISIFSYISNNTSNFSNFVGFAISGANTVAPTDTMAIQFESYGANAFGQYGATFLVTGLTAGSTTFSINYRVDGNTGTFKNRRISVLPL